MGARWPLQNSKRILNIVACRYWTVIMSKYLYKPKDFKRDTPLRDRTMDEKAFIIQGIKRGAYDKQYCMNVLGFGKKNMAEVQ